jgi:hypothetical protein
LGLASVHDSETKEEATYGGHFSIRDTDYRSRSKVSQLSLLGNDYCVDLSLTFNKLRYMER